MKKALTLLLILIFFTACDKEPNNNTQTSAKSTEPKPRPKVFTLHDANRSIQLTFTQGSFDINGTRPLTLVIFFSSGCPACKAELEVLRALYPKYEQKLDIIALQLDQNRIDAPFFISRDMNVNNEIAKLVYPLVHAPASMPIPLSLLLKNNRYFIHYVGAVPQEMLELDIKKALGE